MVVKTRKRSVGGTVLRFAGAPDGVELLTAQSGEQGHPRGAGAVEVGRQVLHAVSHLLAAGIEEKLHSVGYQVLLVIGFSSHPGTWTSSTSPVCA